MMREKAYPDIQINIVPDADDFDTDEYVNNLDFSGLEFLSEEEKRLWRLASKYYSLLVDGLSENEIRESFCKIPKLNATKFRQS